MLRAVWATPPRLGAVRVLAVDGRSGSGKSTAAGELVRMLAAGARVALVSTDDFATWDDPVGWWPRLEAGVLGPLTRGEPGGYRRTEWPNGVPTLGSHIDVPVPDVLVLEGVSAGRRAMHSRLSHLLWVQLADPDLRLERAVAREGEANREPLRAWQRFENGWFAVDRTAERADSTITAAR
ncbi:MAG: uridine kinase [Pseudonocardiaceae bacterium]|nr:uridine kinase [Pseudonocardiaceae bacterium]